MTVHTICDACGMEYDWPGVTVGIHVYCCAGCGDDTGCTCSEPGGARAAYRETAGYRRPRRETRADPESGW